VEYIIFLASAAAVIYSGIKLSVYGDVVADKTGLGHSFVGLALIAFFTSLPELISTIGAVTIVDAPDMAFGNVYGSNMFNMLIIFVLDAVFRKTDVYKGVSNSNSVAGVYAVLITFAAMSAYVIKMPVIGHLNVMSIIIIIIYLLSAYSSFMTSKAEPEECEEGDGKVTLKKAIVMFFIFAGVIVVAGLLLSKSADQIATSTGLGSSFVGSFLLAAVTSLPELSTGIAAVRIGATNMAIGGMFGSNVFNMTIISMADLFYTKGNIFESVREIHLVSAIFASAATLVAILGIRESGAIKFKIAGLKHQSFVILGLYILYTIYMFAVR